MSVLGVELAVDPVVVALPLSGELEPSDGEVTGGVAGGGAEMVVVPLEKVTLGPVSVERRW